MEPKGPQVLVEWARGAIESRAIEGLKKERPKPAREQALTPAPRNREQSSKLVPALGVNYIVEADEQTALLRAEEALKVV
ncbi:hypothetical protein [Ottowia cancrivicina]|uniref:Uncharacterized protein n=1 Tax=Ottowia cancrivicina TaxID=3040346 RepID=A0AAW6RHH1_9BURK|nr:hypothetical protein [Ottowia sp. 10c7w1]MDG9699793.1 hypothetical protein [Ottowia sp. 10c7w1]